ncbi:MAG: ABC transporter substrate-binding protein [Cyanothece sp. SIO2G6]|nr:ABC transporter substrate-binding protein [Cyanothece sp. SIO2G6]
MRRGYVLGLTVLLAGAIAACSTPTPDSSSSATPQAASPDTTATPATKVVALSSISADLVETLAGDALVGVAGSRLTAADPRFEGLTVVSQGRIEPDLEKIIALEPDLVIGAEGFHDTTLQRLEELSISTLAYDIDGWSDLDAFTQELALQLGVDAAVVSDRYDACLAKATTSPKSDSALVLVSRQPMLSPNKDSWAGDFLAQFNINNIATDWQGESEFSGYVTLSAEKVLEANPSALLVIDTGENTLEQFQAEPFWGQLKAAQTEQVHTFDYFGLINPGSLASIEDTCEKLGSL